MLNTGLARQCLASFTAALCMSITSSTFTWLTPLAGLFLSKDSPIPMTELQRSWLSSCPSIGNTISSIPVGIIAYKWGRKPILLAAGPIALFAWILMITTRSLPVLYVAHLIDGWVIATSFNICSVYIAEISSPKIRGTLNGQVLTLYYLGNIYVDIAAAYFVNYTLYLCILSILPIIYTIMFYFMPETPYHLLLSGKTEEAVKVLDWLTPKNNIDITERIKEMKTSIKNDFSWKHFLYVRHHRRALLIVASSYSLKTFTGQISLQIYITQVFTNINKSTSNSIILTLIVNIILCITCFISGFTSDKLGRRPVMYITTFLTGIFNLIISIYFYIYNSNLASMPVSGIWVIFICMTLSLTMNNACMSVFVPTVTSEYFTTEARPLGSAISHAIAGGFFGFISIILFQIVHDNIGDYFNFLIFAICSFAATLMIYFSLRETAKKTLEDIQKELESN